jgi:peptidoglycan/LPS O-acetylase OafA/YrhL
MAVVLLLLIVIMRLRAANELLSRNEPDGLALFATPLNADGLLVGSLMALSVTFDSATLVRRLQANRCGVVIATFFLLAPLFAWDYADNRYLIGVWVVGKSLAWMAAFGLLCVALTISSVSNPILLCCASIGRASYSIYLWHQAVNHLGTRSIMLALGSTNWWLYASVYLGGSLLLGFLMHEIIERPLLALRDRVWAESIRKPL